MVLSDMAAPALESIRKTSAGGMAIGCTGTGRQVTLSRRGEATTLRPIGPACTIAGIDAVYAAFMVHRMKTRPMRTHRIDPGNLLQSIAQAIE
jgi:hypothetical protein